MTDRIIHQDGRGRPKKLNVDRDWFERVYSVELMPTRDIASAIGCVNEHVNALAKKFGIKVRPRLKRSVAHPELDLDVEEIKRLYLVEMMSATDIGRLMGCDAKPITRRLRMAGVKMRHQNDTKRGRPARNKVEIDPGVIASMYAVRFNSAQTIADHFRVSRQVIDRIMKESGIKTKPMGESRNMWGDSSPSWRHDLTEEDRRNRRDMAAQGRWRVLVYARDRYTCQNCGDDKGGNLHAHHVVPHSRDKTIAWELSNGVTMCGPCHISFHREYGYTKCTREDLEMFKLKRLSE